MSTPAADAARLRDGARQMGLELAEPATAALLEYAGLLLKWNRAYNLTAVKDLPGVIDRHLLDSLSVLPYVRGDRVLDLGTGAGLPGLPLAICLPGTSFHLLDSNGKKIRFLFEVKTRLALANVHLHECRAESMRDAEGFDTVVCRAVASLADLARLGGPLLRERGQLIAMKGAMDQAECDALEAPYTVRAVIEPQVPGASQPRRLVVVGRTGDATGSAA